MQIQMNTRVSYACRDMHTVILFVLAGLAVGSGSLLGILIGIICYSRFVLHEGKVKVGKDGYVDMEAENRVCAGYRDVESE